jgi:hypothetical protein
MRYRFSSPQYPNTLFGTSRFVSSVNKMWVFPQCYPYTCRITKYINWITTMRWLRISREFHFLPYTPKFYGTLTFIVQRKAYSSISKLGGDGKRPLGLRRTKRKTKHSPTSSVEKCTRRHLSIPSAFLLTERPHSYCFQSIKVKKKKADGFYKFQEK